MAEIPAIRWLIDLPTESADNTQTKILRELRNNSRFENIRFLMIDNFPNFVCTYVMHTEVRQHRLLWLDTESFVTVNPVPGPVITVIRVPPIAIITGSNKVFFLYGTTNQAVARAAATILGLKDRSNPNRARIETYGVQAQNPPVPMGIITSQLLRKYSAANPIGTLILGKNCCISEEESVALAGHPTPLTLKLQCRFADGGRVFFKTLSNRTSYFGNLICTKPLLVSQSQFTSMFAASGPLAVELQSLKQVTFETDSSIFGSSELPLLFSSNALAIKYKFFEEAAPADIEPFQVLPKSVALDFSDCLPGQLHTYFLQSTASLREFSIIYDSKQAPSAPQQQELVRAIASIPNLKTLKIGYLHIMDKPFWEELCAAMTMHPCLERVVFYANCCPPDPQLVLNLMQSKPNFLIKFEYSSAHTSSLSRFDKEVKLVQRSARLTRFKEDVRCGIVGTAWTTWAFESNGSHSFKRLAISMKDNTDVLCNLVNKSD
jgi:hypothetical protein